MIKRLPLVQQGSKSVDPLVSRTNGGSQQSMLRTEPAADTTTRRADTRPVAQDSDGRGSANEPKVEGHSCLDGTLCPLLFDSNPYPMWIFDRDTLAFLAVNDAAVQLYGYRRDQFLAMTIRDIRPPEEIPALLSSLAGGTEGRSRFTKPFRHRTRDGAILDVEIQWHSLTFAGRPAELVFARDVTERKRAEQAVRESEQRFRQMAEHIGEVFWLADALQGTILYVSPAYERIWGRTCESLYERPGSWAEAIHPEDRGRVWKSYRRSRERGQVWEQEYRVVRPDGSVRHILDRGFPIRDEAGRVYRTAGIAEDITERRQVERQLRLLLESTGEGIYGLDTEGRCTFINQAAASMLGYAPEVVVGKGMHSLVHHTRNDGTTHPLTECPIYSAIRTRHGVGNAEDVFWRADGTSVPVAYSSFPIVDDGQVLGAVVIFKDITEQRRAQEAQLQLAAERDQLLATLRMQIHRMPLIYVLFDADFRIVDWNPAAERTLGYSKAEALRKQPNDFIPASFHQDANRIFDRIRAGDMEAHSVNENLTKDGHTIVCEWFNTPLLTDDGRFNGLLCLGRNVTEQKSLEAQFQQAQKMEAIGQLAGGVAHDFNNLLTIISGYSEILLGRLESNNPMREAVKAISQAGEQAASLTRQLLAFSRKAVLEPKVLELNHIVREAEKLLRRLIGEDVLLTTVLDPSTSKIKVDPGQLGQVLMNLAVNARDAMPKGGKLTVETGNVELDEKYARLHRELSPGRYVRLAITDTGTGMTPEVKAKMFEPFFTTKGIGKGTGLGLAVVLGIVKQSGGHIEVYSEPGIGTAFKLYFPAVAEPVSPRTRLDVASAGRGMETVLLVEDEDGVRGLAALALQGHGYTVLAASNGKEALHLVEKRRDGIDVLVTDVVMPYMGGPDLAAALRPRFPNMKVLFSSGYTNDAVVRHGLLQERVAFIPKPYTPLDLVRRVRQVLDTK